MTTLTRAPASLVKDFRGLATAALHWADTAEARVKALEEGLRVLLDNLSLHGCCPANNCASEDVSGLGGLREPEPHSDGCAYVAARDLLTGERSGEGRNG